MEIQNIIPNVSRLLNDKVEVLEFIEGRSNNIHVVQGSHGAKWIVRIPQNEIAASLSERGTTILRQVKQRKPSLQVPSVIHQAPNFAISSYIDGEVLGVWNDRALSHSRRHKLLDGLAGFLWELWTCPTISLTETGGALAYREWIMAEVDRGIRRSLTNTGWSDPIHFLSRRAKIDSIVPVSDDTALAIRHAYLNAWDIIVNDNGISGVINWDATDVVPLPAAVQHPMFIAGVPGWNNDSVSQDMTFEQDRRYLEAALRKMSTESKLAGATQISDLLANSFERQFFQMSLRNRQINKEWTDKDAGVDSKTALEQLDAFLASDPSMTQNEGVQELRRRLLSAKDECGY